MPKNCAAIVIAAKHGNLIKVKDYSGITNTVGALRCKFEFRTNDWDNASVTAVFCKGNMVTHPEIIDNPKGVILDDEDECAVPSEVLTRDAKYFSVGVWGVTDKGLRIVSDWLVFRIKDGCYVDSTAPIEPTPTVYEQIMMSLNTKAPIDHTHDNYVSFNEIQNKQDTLVSGVNIKTINGEDILGSGDIVIESGGSSGDGSGGVVDQKFNPESKNAQSGIAVAQALEEINIEQGSLKEVVTPNVWELESGAYLVKKGFYWATPRPPVFLNFKEAINCFLLVSVDQYDNNQRKYYAIIDNDVYYGFSVENGINAETGEPLAEGECNKQIVTTVNPSEKHTNEQVYGAKTLDETFVTIDERLQEKQAELVSGTNIKTINGQSILGRGDITIEDIEEGFLTPEKLSPELKQWIRSDVINVKDFGAVGDGVTDDTVAIQRAVAEVSDYKMLMFPKGHYIVKPTTDNPSLIQLIGLKNITIDLSGSTLEVASNECSHYNLFELIDCENFVITNGFLKGDRLTHKYVDYPNTPIVDTHEFGYGILLKSSLISGEKPSDTLKCGGKIENCNIYDFIGDGIFVKNGLSPYPVNIQNCEIHHCRRQGITIADSDTNIIDNCYIHHIGTFDNIDGDDIIGANPMSGIDIEPASGTRNVNLVYVKNTKIEHTTRRSIVCVTPKTYETVDGVQILKEIGNNIKKIVIDNCETGLLIIEANKSFDVGEQVFTDVLIKNSVLNHTIEEPYHGFVLTGATLINSVINVDKNHDYTDCELFVSGVLPKTEKARCFLKGCVLNLTSNVILRWVEMSDTIVNGGILKINETPNKAQTLATIMDCTNVSFNGCSFDIFNIQGLYKFIDCSFKNCVPFETPKPLRFYNCYLDSKYIAGANYTSCIIADENADEISENASDAQSPSAKAVYNYVNEVIGGIENGSY